MLEMQNKLPKFSALPVSAVADWIQTLHIAKGAFRNPEYTPTREESISLNSTLITKFCLAGRDSFGSSLIWF